MARYETVVVTFPSCEVAQNVEDDIVQFPLTAADNDGNASKSNVTQKKGPRARHEANRRYPPKKKSSKKHVVQEKLT